jgi:prepilin peptidase CpaA
MAVAVLGLLRLFLWLFFGDLATALYTIASALVVLLIGFMLFARRFVGGGDVKLLTAAVLLIGCHDLFPFFMIMSIFGALLAIVMLTLRHCFLPAYLGPKFAALAGTTKMMVPYGVAIGVAGSVTLAIQSYQLW